MHSLEMIAMLPSLNRKNQIFWKNAEE